MVVQHNLTAMNSNRMLNVNTKAQAKSTEKLSSGYKINRAADDAAGLSISEKMRKQIRGLTQASANAQDGISAVQTAEGALNEVQDMLQRMNELAVKAANGTNSSDDRTYIQNEVDQLVSEIDRVAETTKFNETYLLKGDKGKTEYTNKYASFTKNTTTDVYHGTPGQAGAFTRTPGNASYTGSITWNGKNFVDDDGVELEVNATTNFTSASNKYGITDISAADTTYFNVGDRFDIVARKSIEFVAAESNALYDVNGNKVSENGLDSYLDTDGTTATLKSGRMLYADKNGTVEITAEGLAKAINAGGTKTGAIGLSLHVGADATANNQITVDIKTMSAKGIGVSGLKVDGDNGSKALDAIETIKAAIQIISTQRSALGAVQNRLDHTINNLDNVVENTTSAESAIRDTDMATEMVKYSNNNILSQAGQAMLAQANQSNQGVLSLLR